MTKERWAYIKALGPTASRWRSIPARVQDEGRNGVKRHARAGKARKHWPVIARSK